jgi:hypothetical protein
MIQRIGYTGEGAIYLVCCDKEDCTVEIEVEEFDFNWLKEYLKEQEWVLIKVKKQWKHYCPSCSKK